MAVAGSLAVLLVAHAFPPTFGGVETHLWDLSHELVRRGHRVHCLVGGGPSEERIDAIGVTRRPALSVQHLLAARRGLDASAVNHQLLEACTAVVGEAMQRVRPDVVHVHNAHHFAPEPALALLGDRAHPPAVNGVHDRVGEHLYPEVLDQPWALVLYASHYLRQTFPDHAAPAAVRWLGIDLGGFAPEGPCDPRVLALERPVLFHPARLLRWKGPDVGVAAFAQLRRRLGRGSLVLCASGNIVDDPAEVGRLRAELEELAAREGVAGSVHFLDIDRRDIAAVYRASDVVWYPTVEDEPYGLVPLEAMAIGRPLVVSDSGGMRETVLSGETGLVVPKGDSAALAAAAEQLLTDRSLRERLVAAGRERARHFDMRVYAAELESVYQSVVR